MTTQSYGPPHVDRHGRGTERLGPGFADPDRTEPHIGRLAWAYSYEVDSIRDSLRVYRRVFKWDDWDERYDGSGEWRCIGEPSEVAYFRPSQWDHVRAD
jgi:hypothetical protein